MIFTFLLTALCIIASVEIFIPKLLPTWPIFYIYCISLAILLTALDNLEKE